MEALFYIASNIFSLFVDEMIFPGSWFYWNPGYLFKP